MNKIERIKMLISEYEKSIEKNSKTNDRLTTLVNAHGVETVSLASGLKISSIIQYTTKTNSPKVSSSTIEKAEYVLNQL